MQINLSLDRRCKWCREDESDHPCKVHFLYYHDYSDTEVIYDAFGSKGEIDDMIHLLEDLHGIWPVHNEYKFRYSYDECQGKF